MTKQTRKGVLRQKALGIFRKLKITSNSVKDTINIGKAIARNLRKGDIICLFGQLGSGKTVLTKGIALGLGVKEAQVTSPSFVLLRQYLEANLPLYHFDFYRLEGQSEIVKLGCEEYFYGDGVSVIEWADRLESLLPKEYLRIELSIAGTKSRRLALAAFGIRYQELLSKINEDISH